MCITGVIEPYIIWLDWGYRSGSDGLFAQHGAFISIIWPFKAFLTSPGYIINYKKIQMHTGFN